MNGRSKSDMYRRRVETLRLFLAKHAVTQAQLIKVSAI